MTHVAQSHGVGIAGRFTQVVAAALVLGLAGPAAWAAGDRSVRVVEDTGDRIVLEYVLGVRASPVVVDGKAYTQVLLDGEPVLNEAGEPALPHVYRSIIIPDDAAMAVRVLDSTYDEVEDVRVAPSKGNLLRTVDPSDGAVHVRRGLRHRRLLPGRRGRAPRSVHPARLPRTGGRRSIPFQYNPVTRTLRVYTR